MKDICILIKSNKNARILMFFSVLLFCGMTASRTLQVLWFEENDAVINFGLSYSAMAAAGAMSFLSGFIVRRIGLIQSLKIGCFIYSVGLALRIFTHSPFVAILSGFIAGIGVSTIFICLQPWIMSWAKEEERPTAISLNQSIGTLGNALGSLMVAALMALLVGFGTNVSFIGVLLLSAIFPIIASLFLTKNASKELEQNDSKNAGVLSLLKNNSLLGLGVIFFGVLAGLYTIQNYHVW